MGRISPNYIVSTRDSANPLPGDDEIRYSHRNGTSYVARLPCRDVNLHPLVLYTCRNRPRQEQAADSLFLYEFLALCPRSRVAPSLAPLLGE